MITTRTQNVYLEDIYSKMRGWATPLKDKTLNNELVDVESVNVPEYIKNYKDPGKNKATGEQIPVGPCSSFVYSTFLPPGYH